LPWPELTHTLLSSTASLALSTNSTTTDSSFRSSFDSSSNSLFTSAIKVASSSDIPSHFDYLNVNESAANVISHSIQKDLHRPQLRPRADSNPLTRLSTSVTESSSPERSHTSLGGAVDRPVVHPRTMTLAESRVWLVGCSYHPSEIAYNSDGVIIGATLPVLVEKMTPHDAMVDPTFSATFFLTFRLFSTPLDILEEVIRRFDLQPPSGLALGPQEFALWQEHKVTPIQLRIFAFLRSWLDHNFLSSVDYVVIPHLIHFATQGSIRHALPSLADKLLDSIEKHVRQASLQPTPEKTIKKISSIERLRNVAVPPTPIMDKKLFNNLKNPASSVSITDFDATELARQLSIMESKLYCAIEPHELLACGKKSVRSIKAMSTFSNQM
jgi:son of sevenless-like protein